MREALSASDIILLHRLYKLLQHIERKSRVDSDSILETTGEDEPRSEFSHGLVKQLDVVNEKASRFLDGGMRQVFFLCIQMNFCDVRIRSY